MFTNTRGKTSSPLCPRGKPTEGDGDLASEDNKRKAMISMTKYQRQESLSVFVFLDVWKMRLMLALSNAPRAMTLFWLWTP